MLCVQGKHAHFYYKIIFPTFQDNPATSPMRNNFKPQKTNPSSYCAYLTPTHPTTPENLIHRAPCGSSFYVSIIPTKSTQLIDLLSQPAWNIMTKELLGKYLIQSVILMGDFSAETLLSKRKQDKYSKPWKGQKKCSSRISHSVVILQKRRNQDSAWQEKTGGIHHQQTASTRNY